MQALEGDFDPSHGAFLHSTLDSNVSNPANKFAGITSRPVGTSPEFVPPQPDPVDFECGIGNVGRATGPLGRTSTLGRGPSWLMPCFDPVGLASEGTYPMNIKVPADDEHTIYFRVRWSPTGPLTEQQVWDLRIGGYINPPQMPGTFLYKDNIFNDYNIDRIKQRQFSFSGMSQTAVQDTAMQENQWGPHLQTVEGAPGQHRQDHHPRSAALVGDRPRADGGAGARRAVEAGRVSLLPQRELVGDASPDMASKSGIAGRSGSCDEGVTVPPVLNIARARIGRRQSQWVAGCRLD